MKVTDVIETFYFLKKSTLQFPFYIMPDYDHGIFNLRVIFVYNICT